MQGDNVLLIVSPNATKVSIHGSTTFSLTGRTSGTYAGLLIASVSPNLKISTGNPASFGGSSSSTFTGAFYFPNSDLDFYGGGSATNNLCAQLIAQKINLQGNSYITDNGTGCGIFDAAGTSARRLLVRLIQ